MAKKKKTSSFRGRVKEDSVRQATKGSNFGYLNLPKDVQIYSPTPGKKEAFDILPYEVTKPKHPDLSNGFPEVGDFWYKRPFKTHTNVGADNETIICLSTFGKKCPICEYKKERAKDGADKDELKAYSPKDRVLYCVVPKDHKKLDEEPSIMDMSWWLFQTQLNEELKEDDDYEVFPDLEEGYTLKVRWKEETFQKNTYAEAGRIDFVSRNEEYDEAILEDVPSLDECLKELSYDDLHNKFHEIDSDEDEDNDSEEEDEKPKRRKKTTSKKVKEKEEPAELTYSDIQDMDEDELTEVIESKDLDVDPEDYDLEELRVAVCEELDLEKPKKKKESKTAPKKTPEKKAGKNKCPHGHKFGKDVDDKPECDDCELWDACMDKSEED